MDIRDVPIVRNVLEARYRRRFNSPLGLGAWYGDYDSLTEAQEAAPPRAAIGYGTAGVETQYDNFFRIDAKDFPVLFWLERILEPRMRVFDFGGNVGHTGLAYRALLTQGSTIDWEVCDLPSMVAEGNRRVEAQQIERLTFTTDRDRASGADVFHTAGSLQYAPQSLGEMLAELPAKPRYVVVNMLPTLADRTTVTLQHIGPAYCPYRIEARATLAGAMTSLGYEQLAAWENPETRTFVPFSKRARRITWTGYCFRRQTSNT